MCTHARYYYTHNAYAHCKLMGWAKRDVPLMLSSQSSCVIVSGFRAAFDLDTYPLSNLIRPRRAEQAKPGRGKPVLIMHIGFFVCFHCIVLKLYLSNAVVAAKSAH